MEAIRVGDAYTLFDLNKVELAALQIALDSLLTNPNNSDGYRRYESTLLALRDKITACLKDEVQGLTSVV